MVALTLAIGALLSIGVTAVVVRGASKPGAFTAGPAVPAPAGVAPPAQTARPADTPAQAAAASPTTTDAAA